MKFMDDVAKHFNEIDREKTVVVICSLAPESVVAGILLFKAFIRDQRKVVLSFQGKVYTQEIVNSHYDAYFFLGFNDIDKDILLDREIFLFSEDICLRVYKFIVELKKKNEDMISYACLFSRELLDEAITSGAVVKYNSIKIFTSCFTPLLQAVTSSVNPYLPGISGNEKGALQFFHEFNLNSMVSKNLLELKEKEFKSFLTAVSLRRFGSEDFPSSDFYFLQKCFLRDSNELLETIVFLCKLKKYSLVAGVCLDNELCKKETLAIVKKYRSDLIYVLDWFYNHKTTFLDIPKFIFINLENMFHESLLEDFTKVILDSYFYPKGKVVVTALYTLDNRISFCIGISKVADVSLLESLKGLFDESFIENGLFFGTLNTDTTDAFIEKLKNSLGNLVIEIEKEQ